MEKENVLEIKVTRINTKYSAIEITKQDEEIIKRGKFQYEASNGLKIISEKIIEFGEINNSLFVRGENEMLDDLPDIVPNEDIPKIEEAIKELNEKYGKVKRWRAKYGENYYYITSTFNIFSTAQFEYHIDNERYEFGNYFKTREQAERAMPKIRKCFQDLQKEFIE